MRSKANIADLPSRSEFGYLHSLGSTLVDTILPDIEEWTASARDWMDKAEMSAGPVDETGKRGRKRKRGGRRAGP